MYNLLFQSIPSGAEIYLDGIDTGQKTPSSIYVEEGSTYQYTLKLDGYYDNTGIILAKAPHNVLDILQETTLTKIENLFIQNWKIIIIGAAAYSVYYIVKKSE